MRSTFLEGTRGMRSNGPPFSCPRRGTGSIGRYWFSKCPRSRRAASAARACSAEKNSRFVPIGKYHIQNNFRSHNMATSISSLIEITSALPNARSESNLTSVVSRSHFQFNFRYLESLWFFCILFRLFSFPL
jgi:hypothetical protein